MSSDGAFSGRRRQLDLLRRDLDDVGSSGTGRFVVMRGRRQVGKSRLIEEFVARVGVRSIFFTATKGRESGLELREFQSLAASNVYQNDPVEAAATFATWDGALGQLAQTAANGPIIIVIDELPYLIAGAPDVEGAFQKAWDRHLCKAPVLLIVVGSDLAMMEALTEYGRPLYGRPTREIHLMPLDPAETADLTGLDPLNAFDAYLVTGGFPNLVRKWRPGWTLARYLGDQLTTSTEVLCVAGERMTTAEFPPDSHARLVLSVIGSGMMTFTSIGARTGLTGTSLDRALKLLIVKRVIVAELPLSGQLKGRDTQYRVADTYLAFWTRFIERSIPLLDRGRGEFVRTEIMRQWLDYRGKAIEPIVRESVARLVPLDGSDAHTVGSYWTRDGNVEVDLVGVEGTAKQRRVSLLGSIKWRERKPFAGRDASALASQRRMVPGTDEDTVLIAVSSSGFDVRDIPVRLGPQDLLDAWR
jgi:uncharacterized protein